MPDNVTARDSATQFTPHPEGQFGMVCVDCIDLGERVKRFKAEKPYLAHCVSLVFQSGEENEDGKLHEINREFTVSMGKKANLRAFLESWRGKSYTEEQAREGVPLHKLVGAPALVSVEHKSNTDGSRTYANIRSISPLPKGMVAPSLPAYERPPYFATRAAKYAEEVRAYRNERPITEHDDEFPAPFDDTDNDLPF